MAFDGIVTKAVVSELKNLINYKIDKIFEPNKNTITLGLYGKSSNLLLNICIDAKYCRINLTTNPKQNPIKAANFCMLLRKHILGYKITNIYTKGLERVVFIDLSSFDDIDNKTLIIELMGKHSNIILANNNNIIIDSLRHTNIALNSYRDIFPGKQYVFPSSDKKDFTIISNFEEFYELLPTDTDDIAKSISNLFTGFSLSFIKNVLEIFGIPLSNTPSLKNSDLLLNNKLTTENSDLLLINKQTTKNSDLLFKIREPLENAFNYIKNIIDFTNSERLYFTPIYDNITGVKKDYVLTLKNSADKFDADISNQSVRNTAINLSKNSLSTNPFPLNFFLDDFYYTNETAEEFTNYRNTVLKLILDAQKKYNKRLENINEKLTECNNMEQYKLYGELITANLYKIKDVHIDCIKLENYYDNNQIITIPLDKKYIPAINAKRYFKKYNKLKNALNIVNIQKQDTLDELNYIESIIYELENATLLLEVQEIFEEISENVIFKEKLQKSSKTKQGTNNHKINANKNSKKNSSNKKSSFNFSPISYTIDNHTVLVGRNNRENDFLTLKYAHNNDIWFHTKDTHGSHVILKVIPNEELPDNLLIKCAKLAAKHSKAKSSSNVPVDYCLVKYVKKPSGSKPGMVIYTNNKTLYVTP